MEKPSGSIGDDGDPKKPGNSGKPSPEKDSAEKSSSAPPSKKAGAVKSEPESSSPTKIKREDSEDSGGRVKTDSSSSSVEDVQRALTEYMTMAQVRILFDHFVAKLLKAPVVMGDLPIDA